MSDSSFNTQHSVHDTQIMHSNNNNWEVKPGLVVMEQ